MSEAPESEVSKPEISEPSSRKLPTEPKRRQFAKPQELVVAVVFIAIVAILIVTLVNKITLNRDVSNARTISNEVVADIQKRDGGAIRSLGSPSFQKTYSAASLTQGFKSVEIATLKTPTPVQQTVVDTPSGRSVYFIYEYTALKVPFYVRTSIRQESGHWYLTSIVGNINESDLLIN
jgi:cytoskeletal protein RodZ